MAPRPAYMKTERIVAWDIGSGGGKVVIWGRQTPVKVAFPTALASPSLDGTAGGYAKPAALVRRYPGDPKPYTRRASTAQKFIYRGLGGPATPGRRFWVTQTAAPPSGLIGKQKWYQFTTTYSMRTIIMKFQTTGAVNFRLKTSGGRVIQGRATMADDEFTDPV